MKVYMVMYSDYDSSEVEKVYLSKTDADRYVTVKTKERDERRMLSDRCSECKIENMIHSSNCKYASIKEDRHGLYCESDFEDNSYGEFWQVVEKDIE